MEKLTPEDVLGRMLDCVENAGAYDILPLNDNLISGVHDGTLVLCLANGQEFAVTAVPVG